MPRSGAPREATPLPRAGIACIFLAQCAQGVQVNMLFPMLVFLVQSWTPAADGSGGEADVSDGIVARRAGMLASCYPLGLMLSSSVSGRILDTWGRKPVLLVGCFSAGALSIALGLSPSYSAAVAIRLLAGCLNSISPAVRCVTAELTDASNQARAMSFISLAWNLGTACGPVLAGALVGLVPSRPFLAPCAAAGALSISAGALVLLFLPETLASKRARSGGSAGQESEGETDGLLAGVGGDSCDASEHKLHARTEDEALDRALRGLTKMQGSSSQLAARAEAAEEGHAHLPAVLEGAASTEHRLKWWQIEGVRGVLASYTLIALVYIMMDELFPMFAASARDSAGLALDTKDISVILSVGGAAVFAFTLLAIPPLMDRYGCVRMLRAGFLLSAASCAMLPMPSLLPASAPRALLLACLCVAQACTRVAGTIAFSSIIQTMANTLGHEYLGRLNATGQSMASAARACGPTLGGVLWSAAEHAAQTGTAPRPQLLAFTAVALVCAVGGSAAGARVPRAFDVPHDERAGDEEKERARGRRLGAADAEWTETELLEL